MNSVTAKIIIRRFVELLLTCAVISSVMTILNSSTVECEGHNWFIKK